MTRTGHPAAISLAAGEGEARWWFGELATIKLTADQTGGQLTLLEVEAPAALEVPLHVHHREDETFWILEGSATFEIGGETVAAGPGTVLFAPRDVPHRYVIGPEPARMLFLFTPGGFDGFVLDSSEPAGARTIPPPSQDPPDMEQIVASVEAYGCEIVGA